MELDKLRLKAGESIFIELTTEISVLVRCFDDRLEISGPLNCLSKTALVSTGGMVIVKRENPTP